MTDRPTAAPLRMGFGGGAVGNLYRALADDLARKTVEAAWDAGIRYFDTAPYYGLGLSERRLGDALRSYDRRDFTLSTKVGRLLDPDTAADPAAERHGFAAPLPFKVRHDYSYDGVMRSYEASLQRLGLARIDTLLVHDIGRRTHGQANENHFRALADGGYRALDELRARGDISEVGLGVNEWEICLDAMEIGRFDVFLLAGRYTLLEQKPLHTFLPQSAAHQARVIVGGAYNSGILATGTRSGAAAWYDYEPAPPAIIERVARMEAVAETHGVTLAAAALQFPLAHPVVDCVIPGLGDPGQVAQALALMSERIPPGFWADLVDAGLVDPEAPLPPGHPLAATAASASAGGWSNS